MFKTIFESDPIPYRLPSERGGIPDGIGLGSLYNGYLVDSPRIYSEEIDRIDGIYTSYSDTVADSFTQITVVGWTRMIYYPGWERLYWRFNGATGAFISRGANPATYYDYDVFQTVDGSVWRFQITGSFVQIDPITLEAIPGTQRLATDFEGVTVFYMPLVDRPNNLIVGYTSADSGLNTVSVFNWTTGEKIRSIRVSGEVINLVPEDHHRCYVICSNGIMNLVDYVSGVVMSTLATPIARGANVNYGYDLSTRRMLAVEVVDNAVNGAGLTTITGYYPVPVPAALTAPIPLRAMRAGRKSKVICRTFGDAGEGINSGRLEVEVEEDADLTGGIQSPDANGYSLFQVLGSEAGTADITITLDVA